MNMDDLKARGAGASGLWQDGLGDVGRLAGGAGGGADRLGLGAGSVPPSDWLKGGLDGLNLNTGLPESPAIVLVAVKPQMMGDALPTLTALGNGSTLFVSVAAGTPIAAFEDMLGADTPPIIRAMPNTPPAAVARGITAITGNAQATPAHLDLAEALLSAVGQVVRLDGEHQMDAVTAVSGSGPAYVFHLIETLAAAGEAEGLPPPPWPCNWPVPPSRGGPATWPRMQPRTPHNCA